MRTTVRTVSTRVSTKVRTTVLGVAAAALLVCSAGVAPAPAAQVAVAPGVAAALAAAPSAAPPTRDSGSGGWYLALGDSLAAGYLHGSGDHRTQGYAGATLAAVRTHHRGATLVNLACSGETTASMISGGTCSYAKGSQLAQAAAFLREHRRTMRLVTIDIGGNDVAKCGVLLLPPSCTTPSLQQLRANLPVILNTLRAAAGPDVQIIVLDYYDPFLVFWLRLGPDAPLFRLAAISSAGLLAGTGGVNEAITSSAAGARADVAQVARHFSTTAFAPTLPFPEHGDVPLNVIRICQWTTMCSNLDFHPNPKGYAVLADAVVDRLRR
ncbi:MAG TPA: SGNH/GDSL hydrolase family protein [Humibacillus xanthopallidus]|nr:SGNH/GDSL hydrolase family protein [Humibacillus xanthopallidus]